MKLNKKILNSSLVIILALSLTGCATNATPSSHKTNETTSAKVVKQGHKKTVKDNKAKGNHQADKSAVTNNTKRATDESGASGVQTSNQSKAAITTSSSNTSTNKKASLVATTNHESQSRKTTSATSVEQAASTITPTVKTATSKATTNTPTHQEIQLGLGDVASWTDSKGITHHVDSDGMDRQTTAGSSQVHYQDWSGSLPQNAVVNHNN